LKLKIGFKIKIRFEIENGNEKWVLGMSVGECNEWGWGMGVGS
jgi:hypothetical protein